MCQSQAVQPSILGKLRALHFHDHSAIVLQSTISLFDMVCVHRYSDYQG